MTRLRSWLRRLFRRAPADIPAAKALPSPADGDLIFVLRHRRFHGCFRQDGGIVIGLVPLVGAPVLFYGTLDHAAHLTAQVLRADKLDELAILRDSVRTRGLA